MNSGRIQVAALLRVSTVRQARNHREDEETIPVQRTAIRRFVTSRPGWDLVREYAEEGVSAWSNSSDERHVLQEVLADARQGVFNVLVIFKADRLSRVSLEYPMLLSQLYRLGVTVWSVADDGSGRELKIEGQMDKLLRFVEGWQAETESYNTSIRVKAKMRQLAEQGLWTGGKPPYGFHLLNGGRQKSGGVLSLEIDPEEAAVVRTIFDLYLNDCLGSNAIAAKLNGAGHRLRNGKPWSDGDVRRVIRNPIVAGRPAYGRTHKRPDTHRQARRPSGSDGVVLAPTPIPEWQIVSWETWVAANQKMDSFNRGAPDGSVRYSKAFSGPLLLTGLLRCGHCGGPITGGYSMPKHRKQDGTVVQYRYPRYVCGTKRGRGTDLCDGQRSYSAKQLDRMVLEAVHRTLAGTGVAEIATLVRQRAQEQLWRRQTQQQLAAKRLEKAERLYQEWTQRLNAFLLHPENSLYPEAFLAERVREALAALESARTERDRLQTEESDVASRLADLDEFLKRAPGWWQHFLAAPRTQQKHLLRQVLSRIVVSREGVEIHWRIDLGSLLGSTRSGTLEWSDQAAWPAAL
jgi:site-specific DNA recombinase